MTWLFPTHLLTKSTELSDIKPESTEADRKKKKLERQNRKDGRIGMQTHSRARAKDRNNRKHK